MKKIGKGTIYFAHPVRFYSSRDEGIVLKHLHKRFPGYRIVNPKDISHPTHSDCRQCMREIMIPVFFKAIAKCTLFVIWNPVNSCGIRCELHKAWELNKPVKKLSLSPLSSTGVYSESIELQEYHYSDWSKE